MITKRIAILLLAAFALTGCERKNEPNKILDGFPAGSSEIVIPGKAAQQFVLLKRDMLRVVVPVISKLETEDSSFSELSGPVALKYSFQAVENHYGAATFTIEFKDEFGTTFDPIAIRNSSTTLKSVIVTGSAVSPEFPTITETITLVLQSSGVVRGAMRAFGSTVFTGSSYSLTFQLDPSGSNAIFEALTDGITTVTGTGGTPPATATLNLAFNTDRSVNGNIAWEGREGGIRLENNGTGFIVEPAGRILLD